MKAIDVTAANVDTTGFFCYMSKRKSEGYARKLQWLKDRFDEGLRIKMLGEDSRGFIEYIPGEFAWRAVNARDFMFVHCLWVVGQSKGKGYAQLLLDECLKDAKKSGMKGVVMATSDGNWLLGKKMLLKNGFQSVDQAPPSFELMVRQFRSAPSPSFVKNVDRRARKYPFGLTVFRSDQCPYLDDATRTVAGAAKQFGLPFRAVHLRTAADVRRLSPSVYGAFSIVCQGELLSYHYQLQKDLAVRLKNLQK